MTRLYVACLLDATGSMQSIKGRTISAFNEYFNTLRQDDDLEVLASLFTFNSVEKKVLLDVEPLSDLDPLTDENYRPDMNTPLYDAMAWAIKKLDEAWANKRAKRIMVVLTDGEENDSREYNEKDVASLVRERRDQGWEFVYLGANQDSWRVAGRMAIPKQSTSDFNATPDGVQAASGATASATLRAAHSGKAVAYNAQERTSMEGTS